MQNLRSTPNDILLDNNFGRPNNETSHYSDSDSWDTDFEDEGIESTDLYGDADTQKRELDKSRNQYNVASLTKTIAASLQVGSNSFCSGSDRVEQRPKNEAREVSQKKAPSVPDRPWPPTVSAAATLKNKTVSSLPKPPCQASEHVRQVIGNLGQLWSPEKSASLKPQNDDDYEPIHSGSETPMPAPPKVPPETQKSFLHSCASSSSSSGTPPSTSSTPGASSATPTRRAPPRPTAPPSVPFVHGAGAANALSRLATAAAAAAESSKQQQQLSARTSKTLPVETKEKCIDDKRAATLPAALLPPPPPPPSTSPLPPLVSNRPLPPTPAGASSGASSTTSSPTTTSNGANRANYLSSRPWFHDVDRRRAEELVRNGVDGYFLVRPSSQSANALTLTMWYNHRVYNISIRLRPDGRIALGTAKPKEQSFPTVEEMVANYQSENLVLFSGGERTGLTVLTTYPPHKN